MIRRKELVVNHMFKTCLLAQDVVFSSVLNVKPIAKRSVEKKHGGEVEDDLERERERGSYGARSVITNTKWTQQV